MRHANIGTRQVSVWRAKYLRGPMRSCQRLTSHVKHEHAAFSIVHIMCELLNVRPIVYYARKNAWNKDILFTNFPGRKMSS
jgi:hypothetical protein